MPKVLLLFHMDIGSFVAGVIGDWVTHLVTAGITLVVAALLSWLFHRRKFKFLETNNEELNEQIDLLRGEVESLKSNSPAPVINNVVNNIVPADRYRVDSKNEFVEFGTVKGNIRVRLGDPRNTSKDIAQWLHDKRMIAPLDMPN